MVPWLVAALSGCGIIPMPGGEPEPTCDLTLGNLAGKTFVMLEALPEGEKKNPLARVKFVEDGGKTVAKYTVASLSDVYDMPCEARAKGEGQELFCREEPRPQDWCQALLVADADCTKKVLKELGATQSDDELNEAIKAAKENVKKFKGTENWKQFQLNNNNLGNKLQGRLYVEVDDKRCRLKVGDYYWTIFNGKATEDTNPVGQNPFVQDDGEWLFEHCVEGNIMPGLESDTLPEDLSSIPARGRRYEAGKGYWFHYLGEKNVQAEEGCRYSYDLWAQWRKVSTDNAVTPGEGAKLAWKAQHTFAEGVTMMGAPNKVSVLTMVRYKECGGAKQKLDVVCEAGLLD